MPHPYPFLQDRNGNQLRSPRGEMGLQWYGRLKEGLLSAEKLEPSLELGVLYIPQNTCSLIVPTPTLIQLLWSVLPS